MSATPIDIESHSEKKNAADITDQSVTYVDGFKEDQEDHISIESETNEPVLRQPPDGGKAWLVLLGCFCVSSGSHFFLYPRIENKTNFENLLSS